MYWHDKVYSESGRALTPVKPKGRGRYLPCNVLAI